MASWPSSIQALPATHFPQGERNTGESLGRQAAMVGTMATNFAGVRNGHPLTLR